MKSRPVIIITSILAALDVIAAGAVLGDVLGPTIFALFVLGTKAVNVGFAAYVQATQVPFGDVAAYRTADGPVVAGPAAGVQDGEAVTVATARH